MRILLIGRGKMGRMLEDLLTAQGHTLLGAVGRGDKERLAAADKADAVIDFSDPALLPDLAAYIRRTKSPLCCGTTGYSAEQQRILQELSAFAPVLYSANFSLGIALFRRILSQVSPILLDGFDVEMVETHHNQKIDAPSGTAKLLADAVDPSGRLRRVYGRSGKCGKRARDEMGIFSMRGGTVSGAHTVSFFGEDETFSITHSAASRRIFAAGALKAAAVLTEKPPGLYELEDILFGGAE